MTARNSDSSDPLRRDIRRRDAAVGDGLAGAEIAPSAALERLLDLERRSLLAEQARQQAHALRSPLSVIDLIAETLKLDSAEDPIRIERLARVQGAAASLAQGLSDNVNATRFGDGPWSRADVCALAGDVVKTFGGEVACCDHELDLIELEPASFQAACVHALRLIGVGTEARPRDDRRVVLQREQRDDVLRLSFLALADRPPDVPLERADLGLMVLAARRAAADLGGSLTVEPNRVLFEVPSPAA